MSATSRSVQEALADARSKGVIFWLGDGRLHYSAPKGVLSPEEISTLSGYRAEIIATLQRTALDAAAQEARLVPRRDMHRAPMTFSQLWYWDAFQLGKRPSLRGTSHASRLAGRLEVDALQRSFQAIINRHESLRTRIVTVDGVPEQRVDPQGRSELAIESLESVCDGEREILAKEAIEREVTESIDIAADSLFSGRLLRLREDEHVLILAMDHMISDAFSIEILLRDFFTAYSQAVAGEPFSFPIIDVQYADYATWQRKEQDTWSERDGSYWKERLLNCNRWRFPVDIAARDAGCCGVVTIPIYIGKELTYELRELCRRQATTVAMAVLTAYAALLLRWCNSSETLIQYQTNGRASSKVQNTMGYFASLLCLHVRLAVNDDFTRLLSQVTGECSEAYEHGDNSYMATQVLRPEFARNSIFNWIPHEPRIAASKLDNSEQPITAQPIQFLNPALRTLEWDSDPEILLFDGGASIAGHLYFPRNRFSVPLMERFARNILNFLQVMVKEPERHISKIALAS